MVVCPTGAGLVVTVDLGKRSLAWAYRYETVPRSAVVYQGREEETAGAHARRWQDSTATIVSGRVLLTPPESNELHCIDLQSGQVLWKRARGDMTRIAAADAERVLLVGNRKLRALRTADGKPAWKREALTLPRGVSPSGTGFVSNGQYFLPLTSAEVIAVNLSDGQIASRAASRDGSPLGNLICHRGTVISQSGIFLDCFDEVEQLKKRSEKRLNEEPNDVEALRTLGEVAYNEGRLVEAIDLLERAYGVDPDNAEVQDVLFECLTAALDQDFVANRQRLPLLKALRGAASSRELTVLRLEAQGTFQEGDVLASAGSCLELYRAAKSADEMLAISRKHNVAVSRWVQAQLVEIWKAAEGEQRRQLEQQLSLEAERLGDGPSREELSRFLAFFGELPTFEPLKLTYVRQLTNRDDWLEAQQLLLDLENSSLDKVCHESLARIASQLHEAGLHQLSSEYDRKLAALPSDTKVLGDLTAQQLLEKQNPAGLVNAGNWPRGSVRVSNAATSNVAATRVNTAVWGVRFERADSILGRSVAQLSARGGEIVLHDSLGREFFRANLEAESHIAARQGGSIYAVSRGNLLIVSMGKQIVAFNTLATQDGLAPKVVWRFNLGSNLNFSPEYYGEPTGGQNRPGSHRAPRPMDEGKWVGVIGPVTSRGVVFQDQGRLLCVDATTGEIRWSRTDVPQGCDLFGDAEYLIAVPTGSSTARIFSLLDGRAVGKRQISPSREQLATYGRDVLSWTVDGAAMRLSAVDAVSGEASWQHEFEAGAAVDIEMGRYVAVAETKGRVTVIDGKNGAKLVDYQSVSRPMIEAVHLAVGTDTFQVAVNHPRQESATRSVRGFNPVDSPVINGDLFLFDRQTGEMRWNRAAEVRQQALLLTQGVDLPFIVFPGLVTRTDGGGSRSYSTMLILDKATGRTLYQSEELPQTGGGHCSARVTDAANRQAAVDVAGQTILLQFTDERRPPEPPALAEVESNGTKSTRGLMGIILNIGGGR
jgi:outer membrane protein assembly factor BamB